MRAEKAGEMGQEVQEERGGVSGVAWEEAQEVAALAVVGVVVWQ